MRAVVAPRPHLIRRTSASGWDFASGQACRWRRRSREPSLAQAVRHVLDVWVRPLQIRAMSHRRSRTSGSSCSAAWIAGRASALRPSCRVFEPYEWQLGGPSDITFERSARERSKEDRVQSTPGDDKTRFSASTEGARDEQGSTWSRPADHGAGCERGARRLRGDHARGDERGAGEGCEVAAARHVEPSRLRCVFRGSSCRMCRWRASGAGWGAAGHGDRGTRASERAHPAWQGTERLRGHGRSVDRLPRGGRGGKGTLTIQGQTYPFDIAGLGGGGVGFSTVDASGEV